MSKTMRALTAAVLVSATVAGLQGCAPIEWRAEGFTKNDCGRRLRRRIRTANRKPLCVANHIRGQRRMALKLL